MGEVFIVDAIIERILAVRETLYGPDHEAYRETVREFLAVKSFPINMIGTATT